MYLVPELYALKTVRTINFKLCVRYHNNKRLKKRSEDRIQFAKKRIIDYLNGDISVIDELEADILPFDGRDDEVSWNLWYRNISPAN